MSPRPTGAVTRVVLVGTSASALVLAVVPELRSPAVVIAAWGAVALVLGGVARHQPSPSRPWVLLALMLTSWAVATTAVQLQEEVTAAAAALVGAGQVVAVIVTASVLPRLRRPCLSRSGLRLPRFRLLRRPAVQAQRSRRTDSAAGGAWGPRGAFDGVVIVVVLGLVTAQIVAAAATGARSATTVVVPVVDVAILGLLLRFVASRRLLSPANYLTVTAAVATVGYDLSSAVQGDRLALPGTSAQVLGVVCVLLFGAAAQHPSMATAFSPTTLTRRRAPSAALLGLLPLVAVPLALWWVSSTSSVPGLPTPVLLAAASAVAGLCLVRAAAALRTSEHLADHDPLTGLVNRRGLASAYGVGAPVGGWALLLVDVDDFKQVNDTHGHAVGDELLRQVRDRLLAASGTADVVARLGGDEFVVLTTDGRARTVAGAVLRSLREPVELDALEVRTSASIGLAEPDQTADLDELVTRADIAMYVTKAAGRDGVTTFEPRMRADVAHRYGLTGDLRRLLGTQPAGREGHLELHYQPLVDLATGRPVGAEALVRWQHPRHGLLGPAGFLDLVSAGGMDADLDAAVLATAVQQLARWREQGLTPLPVSVNLTCASLLHPRLDERVLGLLAVHDVPAHLLHVEITEHEELPTDGPAGRTLRRLSDAGIAVHLDDYGIGYTSLSYLNRFPVEVLKLDRSVVEAITTGEQSQLVIGIRAMADTLGLDLLAEGVETLEQYDRLRAIGVRYGQGYLFSRPLPADDYATHVLRVSHRSSACTSAPRPRLSSEDLRSPPQAIAAPPLPSRPPNASARPLPRS